MNTCFLLVNRECFGVALMITVAAIITVVRASVGKIR